MLCEPVSLGFNVGDVQVMNHLPSICVNLLKALKKAPCRDLLETHLKEKVTAQRWALGPCSRLLWVRSSLILMSRCSWQPCAQLQCPRERDLSVPMCAYVCARALVCAHTNDLIHFLEIMTFTNSSPACRMGENSRCTTFAVLWAFLWCYLCVFQDHVSESEGQVTSKVMIAHTIP